MLCAVLQGHYSAVTSLCLAPDGWSLISAGRDKVVHVWDLRKNTKLVTIPVYEALEGDTHSCFFWSCGDVIACSHVVTSFMLLTCKCPYELLFCLAVLFVAPSHEDELASQAPMAGLAHFVFSSRHTHGVIYSLQ